MPIIMPQEQAAQRETTSLKLRPDLWKEAKIEAIKQGKTLSDFVEEALQNWLKETKRK
jgi:predicted HicB family RNase H-like nuclease